MSTNKFNNNKDTGFKVPKGYFDSLEAMLLSEIKLKERTTESGFKTPDNYFDSLGDKITKAIKPEPDVKVIKLFTWRKVAYITSIAASLILMFNILFNKSNIVTIDTIETVSIENYILNEDLETSEIASLFTDEDLSDVQLINDGFSSETLENYIFNNVEIDDFIIK